jgi:hypothetical protein
VKHISRDELFEDEVGLTVAELVQLGPELVGGVQLPNPDRGGLRPWFQDPRGRDPPGPVVDLGMVQRMNELGAVEPGASSPPPHRQFVAKRATRGLAHPRHEQVLAQHRRHPDVEVVERHDTVDPLGSRQVGGTLPDVVERHVAPDVIANLEVPARGRRSRAARPRQAQSREPEPGHRRAARIRLVRHGTK